MKTSTRPSLMVIDPIPYRGGSKVASAALLNELADKDFDITIYTRNSEFWLQQRFAVYPIFELSFLEKSEQGPTYFIKHALLSLQIMFYALLKRPTAIVGISGPGVDLSAYLCSKTLSIPIYQIVHGPIANSKTVRKYFEKSTLVACLESVYEPVKKIFTHNNKGNFEKILPMRNGIPDSNWPTPCNHASTSQVDRSVRIFWAASLLKWKRLDLLLSAIEKANDTNSIHTTICYIRPQGTDQPTFVAPLSNRYVSAVENPHNLDKLRSECNVFVSTSISEPFGLSILEAMAAGLCVLIPKDGAFWDKQLEDGINCIKYTANDPNDLFLCLKNLTCDNSTIQRIGNNGKYLANQYRASKQYEPIVNRFSSNIRLTPHESIQ